MPVKFIVGAIITYPLQQNENIRAWASDYLATDSASSRVIERACDIASLPIVIP